MTSVRPTVTGHLPSLFELGATCTLCLLRRTNTGITISFVTHDVLHENVVESDRVTRNVGLGKSVYLY